jgi:UDP-N-acetylglucosamine/UDP-N-acetylgalactosamine diphosphorylase
MLQNKSKLAARLAPHGQQHLLAFWDRLTGAQQQKLTNQIATIDFDRLLGTFRASRLKEDWTALARRAEGPPAIRLDRNDNRFSAAEARHVGEQALRAGRVGVVLVAGGQGTRLGFDHPKGCFSIGPISRASLFQILLEKVLATSRRYGAPLPLYLMTSDATHDDTAAFLGEHERFGLRCRRSMRKPAGCCSSHRTAWR